MNSIIKNIGKKFLLSFVLIFSVMATSFAQNQSDGKVAFSIKKGFSTVKGEFQKFDYAIDLNGEIGGTARVASVKTKSANRDKHLQSEDWFFAEKYPMIEVKSQKINKKSDMEYVGVFEVKIKGKTETKEIPFQVVNQNGKKYFKANFQLSLDTFNIGSGFLGFLVGDKVTVDLNLPF
ncbi:YceI family protein [Capnocytophaga sp.]|uniref:YceI family protein n=1 Tax=Capnocytophaga sp. TaxID=44737 RepID=UPI0026DCE46B|nr:YceI family protein [Capnocytophaga sp.]MDO5105070.1 YceI family protein [Capnocytophaga sp.]